MLVELNPFASGQEESAVSISSSELIGRGAAAAFAPSLILAFVSLDPCAFAVLFFLGATGEQAEVNRGRAAPSFRALPRQALPVWLQCIGRVEQGAHHLPQLHYCGAQRVPIELLLEDVLNLCDSSLVNTSAPNFLKPLTSQTVNGPCV